MGAFSEGRKALGELLLIGGFDVMLMAIRERTRKIGIRMAKEARQWDI